MFPTLANSLAFLGFSLALVAVPGPSVMFALGRTIAGGLRAGLITVLFNSLGVIVWGLVVAFGLGGLVQSQPFTLNLIQLAGALYLFFIGAQSVWRSRRSSGAASHTDDLTAPERLADLRLSKLGREAFIVGVTNPKLAIFFCAVLPQFVDSREFATSQMLWLGAIFFVVAVLGDGSWVLAAGVVRNWLAAKPARILALQMTGGLLICLLALLLLIDGLPHFFM